MDMSIEEGSSLFPPTGGAWATAAIVIILITSTYFVLRVLKNSPASGHVYEEKAADFPAPLPGGRAELSPISRKMIAPPPRSHENTIEAIDEINILRAERKIRYAQYKAADPHLHAQAVAKCEQLKNEYFKTHHKMAPPVIPTGVLPTTIGRAGSEQLHLNRSRTRIYISYIINIFVRN